MTPHIIFTLVTELGLLFAVTINLVGFFRTRKIRRELNELLETMAAFDRDKAPMLVHALDSMATAVCPLCAICNGMDLEPIRMCAGIDGTAQVEPEEDGHHTVTGTGQPIALACRAARIRADARMVIQEAMDGVEKKAA